MKVKPQRAFGRPIKVEPDDTAEYVHDPVSAVALADPRATRWWSWVLSGALLLVVLAAVAWVALSVTVLGLLNVGGHRAVVLRGGYPQGQVPAGTTVYATTSPSGTLLQRLNQTFSSPVDGKAVLVIGLPGQRIHTSNGTIWVNDKPTVYAADVPSTLLNHAYLTICQAGDCTPGDVVTIPQDQVLGPVNGWVGTAPPGMG